MSQALLTMLDLIARRGLGEQLSASAKLDKVQRAWR